MYNVTIMKYINFPNCRKWLFLSYVYIRIVKCNDYELEKKITINHLKENNINFKL